MSFASVHTAISATSDSQGSCRRPYLRRINPRAALEFAPDSDQAPYFLSKIPRLVETRGGDYFFIPSMTALRMIAKGIVDPT